MSLAHTRTILRAALSGQLENVPMETDPVFGLHVPKHVEGVPDEMFRPRDTWADKAAYDAQAKKLAALFHKNFEKYASEVAPSVRAAGPQAG
jgi:phosphoenolpyruvate carboxykinase (ATP)